MDADTQHERDLVLARHLQIGGCRFDRTLNEVHDEGRCTRLMPKAVAVLEVLIHFAGRPVSKDRLLLEAWHGETPTEDVITNAISQLRRAFGDDARDSRYIRTLPRVGYALIADVARAPDVPASDAGVDAPAPDVPAAAPCRVDVPTSKTHEPARIDVALLAAPSIRRVHVVHAWVALLLILLALAAGIVIGSTPWRSAQVPQHILVPLGGQSVPASVSDRHDADLRRSIVTLLWGFRRDGGGTVGRSFAHEQAGGQAWTG